MPLLHSVPFRLACWLRKFLSPADGSRSNILKLTYDQWHSDSSVPIEGKHTTLPVHFRFGPSGCKSVTLRANRPLKLTCVIGSIWFTKERDTVDYVLSAGQSVDVPDARSVVVFALHFGLLRVEPAAAV